jgi:hypothetical protein
LVISPQFDVAGDFQDGRAVAGMSTNVPMDSGLPEARLGYIDITGAWIFTQPYAEPPREGFA